MKKILLGLIVIVLAVSCKNNDPDHLPGYLTDVDLIYDNSRGLLPEMADPFVLAFEGKYYLYGTDDMVDIAKNGFKVYVSRNLVDWTEAKGVHPEGRALLWEDSWYRTDHIFTCPEVYYKNGVFYMFYVVDGRIAVAKSTSPLGPFTQAVKQPLTPFDAIDPHLFADDDGKSYLYFVSFDQPGNQIYVQELNDDWNRLVGEKTLCLEYSQPWENADPATSGGVCIIEGPTMLKRNGVYYLVYSANHFVSKDHYSIGYATSDSPLGPWVKYEGNPILKPTEKNKGTGHNDFTTAPDGSLYIVYHTHKSSDEIGPRKLAIDSCSWEPNPIIGMPDILKTHVTDTPKKVAWEKVWYNREVYGK